MLILKNLADLKNNQNNVKKEILNSVELDLTTIEDCYEYQSEEYGPLVIIVDSNEKQDLIKKFPIIEKLEPEDPLVVFEDESKVIKRVCYIVNDAGFAVYISESK